VAESASLLHSLFYFFFPLANENFTLTIPHQNFHNIKVEISEQIKGKFEVHSLRWKVERTFAWFNFSRRLSKDYEISPFYQEQICIISNLQTLLRRF